MTGTLPIVLIVVVWLFVLAPIALRGRKPIRHTNDAFEETRVIHAGGEELRAQRRRPRLTPADVRARAEEEADVEPAEPEDLLIDSESEGPGIEDRIGQTFGRIARSKNEMVEETEIAEATEVAEEDSRVEAYAVGEDKVVAEAPAVESSDEELAEFDYEESEYTADFEYTAVSEDEAYPYDDAYLSPADFLHDGATYETADDYDPETHHEEESYADDELSAEDLEFAARRRGRGGYDPQADAAATAQRYQRRQHTLLLLIASVIGGFVAASILGGSFWNVPSFAIVLTVSYLFALRRQVQQEQALRARRIRHMRRARLGVRSAESQELGLPSRLRRPGAVVLELDDDCADFMDLSETYSYFEPELVSREHAVPRRVG